ncbi:MULTISPECIES: DUF4019 domain-containing protein [Klebsiella]|uniref:DUF4019 domain-containing protein n=1 Tax=Klebsiella TaxID=570 RepID=UPI0007D0BE95|nr:MULTISPECIES: DUF4019 domain-containing protein [Klebsiella]SBN08933.1 membrane hypothetical protein [Klebsiella variicola]
MSLVNYQQMQIIAAFTFGIIFVSVVLFLVFYTPNLDSNKMWVVHVVMSLAAAGVAAVLPGFIDLQGRLPWLNMTVVRAGGALAIFCLVFLYPINKASPPSTIPYTPETNSFDKARRWIDLINIRDFQSAYKELTIVNKGQHSLDSFISDVEPIIKALGNSMSQNKNADNAFSSPPANDYPVGSYRYYRFLAKFSNETDTVVLEVLLVGEEETKDWKVYSFSIQKINPSGNLVPVTPW